MFGVQFYPTPDHLIDRMVEPFVGSRWRAFTKSRILEPSAGKGDIEWFESTFFRIKFFKKGTVHLEFKDEHAWAEFNRRAAAGKNWIGGGY